MSHPTILKSACLDSQWWMLYLFTTTNRHSLHPISTFYLKNKCLFVRFAQRKLVGHLFWLAGPVFQPPHWIRDTFPLPGQAAIRARKSGNSPGTRVVLFSLVSALGLSPRFGPKSNSKMPFDHYHHQIRKKWWILAAKLQVGSWAGSSILIKFHALVAT